MLAGCALFAAQPACAQNPGKPLGEEELKTLLIWSSPWQGRSLNPPGLYSYRTVFRQRRDALIAEVTSLSTNQQATSVVSIKDGAVNWFDSNGAEVNVSVSTSGELVGTAVLQGGPVPVALKPRN